MLLTTTAHSSTAPPHAPFYNHRRPLYILSVSQTVDPLVHSHFLSICSACPLASSALLALSNMSSNTDNPFDSFSRGTGDPTQFTSATMLSPLLPHTTPSLDLSSVSFPCLSPLPFDWPLVTPASPLLSSSTDGSVSSHQTSPSCSLSPRSTSPQSDAHTTTTTTIDTSRTDGMAAIHAALQPSAASRAVEEERRGQKRRMQQHVKDDATDLETVHAGRPIASTPYRRRRLTEPEIRLRRQKQHTADVQRRHREQTAITQLQQLLPSHDESNLAASDARKQRPRADLLEESVQHIEQLHVLVAKLTSAPNQHEASVALMAGLEHSLPLSVSSSTTPLCQLPLATSALLANVVRRLSLHSSMYVRSPVCVTVVHVPSGLIADVSDSQLLHTGWQRPHVIGRRMFPPLHALLYEPKHLTDPHSDVMQDNRTLVAGPTGRLVASKQEPQYESSVRAAQQLLSGEKDVVVAVWRGQFADGKVYEVRGHSWVSEWQDVMHDGVQRRSPCHTMSVINTSDTVCVS